MAAAAPSAVKIRDTIVDTQALILSGGSYGDTINGVSFQQDAVVTHNGWQYVTYYNTALHVCVARRQLPSGSWETLELTDYTFVGGNDAHNVISMGICPNDGTIHLSFDHHGHPLHYRVSQAGITADPEAIPWNASLFSEVRNYLEVGQPVSGVTYPRFWQAPAGNLQMSYRIGGSGSGDIIFVDYDAAQGIWKNTRMVFSRNGTYNDVCGTSTSRNAYLNYPGYGPDGVLHITWTWRESSGGTNHDICHTWSDDGGVTWYNSAPPLKQIDIYTAGQTTQTLLGLEWTATGPGIIGYATGSAVTQQLINVDSTDHVVIPVNRQYSLMNQQSQAIDPAGRVHTVMWYATDGVACNTWASSGREYHHYWRDLDGKWNHFKIPCAVGSRPKIFIRDNGDMFMVFLRSGGVYIAAASARSQWTDWQEIASDTTYIYAGEGLGDVYRFQQADGMLSVMAQEGNTLHILDWQLN